MTLFQPALRSQGQADYRAAEHAANKRGGNGTFLLDNRMRYGIKRSAQNIVYRQIGRGAVR